MDFKKKQNSKDNLPGVKIPEILFPSESVDLTKWPVVACDQYTSAPDYWQRVENFVSSNPSSYHIVLPELYLENPGLVDIFDRIESINNHMKQYIDEGVLTSLKECMVLVERYTGFTGPRKGLVLAVDLEKYDYEPGKNNLIRPSEGTIVERIPPRLRIRKNALLEISHVQLLFDDPDNTIIAPLSQKCNRGDFELLYDIDLIENGGHVKGYCVPAKSLAAGEVLCAMSELKTLKKHGLLFIVGDGNHSLATAKAHWNTIKSSVPSDHPARYALVELINIHDDSLIFKPIHRVLFNVSFEDFIARAAFILKSLKIQVSTVMSVENAIVMSENIDSALQPVPLFCKDEAVVFTFSNPKDKFAVSTIQFLIDTYLKETPKARVDYIHGKQAVLELSKGNIGILLPSISKHDFFDVILSCGILPRKAFSMGKASEKRYYMESKMIVDKKWLS